MRISDQAQLSTAHSILTAHSLMVTELKKSGEDILDTLNSTKSDLIHMAMGISGEAGELLDAIKKAVIYNKALDRENVVEELGDLEFYLEGIRQILGITREATLQHNLNKLLLAKNARYAKGTYSDEQAQERADKQEADIALAKYYGNRRPKLLILGHGRHGKDTVAELIAEDTGLKPMSSSWFAAKQVVYPAFQATGLIEYPDLEACYADRANHRRTWFSLIAAYNVPEPTRLAKELLQEADIYVGMRNNAEYQECMKEGLFDLVLWVDASHRSALESVTSFNIQYNPKVMLKLDNNGTLEDLRYELKHKLYPVLADVTKVEIKN